MTGPFLRIFIKRRDVICFHTCFHAGKSNATDVFLNIGKFRVDRRQRLDGCWCIHTVGIHQSVLSKSLLDTKLLYVHFHTKHHANCGVFRRNSSWFSFEMVHVKIDKENETSDWEKENKNILENAPGFVCCVLLWILGERNPLCSLCYYVNNAWKYENRMEKIIIVIWHAVCGDVMV